MHGLPGLATCLSKALSSCAIWCSFFYSRPSGSGWGQGATGDRKVGLSLVRFANLLLPGFPIWRWGSGLF